MQSEKPSGSEIYDTPLEKVFDKIITPFEEFIHNQASSGLLLMATTILALILANTVLSEFYVHILHTHISISIAGLSLEKTVHHWINDGLMSLFFFLVGLEIKREVLVGELSDLKQAMLPIFAAVGGMVVPALLYSLVNGKGEAISGWGIPMATDIAFAVGAMVILGKRVPPALLAFLVALAIVDDLGGILVIAVFYTDDIGIGTLWIAGALLAILVLLNRFGVRNHIPYFLIGGLLWLAVLKSGVHATLAGVLTAFTIPARPKYNPQVFSQHVRDLMKSFDSHHRPNTSIMVNEGQRAVLQTLENAVHKVTTPLQRLEHALHLPVALLIIPVFALANAGIPVAFSELPTTLSHPVTLGIMLGLVVGKLVGISGFSWLAIRLGLARLPRDVRFTQIIGVSLLGGIGFTMSIFIAELAFNQHAQLLLQAKTGILFASLIAGILGILWLYRVSDHD